MEIPIKIIKEGLNRNIQIGPDQEIALKKMETVQLFLDDATTGFNSAFNKAAW